MLKEGDLAPDFAVPSTGSGTRRLADLKGRKVVLYFYPKDDTSGCTRQAIEFNALRSSFEAAGTEVIGLSPDSLASHEKFRKKHGLEIELASDESKETLERYGVWTEKSMYGRNYMGVERTTFLIGPDGRIVRVWSKVKDPGHAEEVLAAASAL